MDCSCRNPLQFRNPPVAQAEPGASREGTAREGKFSLHPGARRRRAAPKGCCSCLSSIVLPTKWVWPRSLFAAGVQGADLKPAAVKGSQGHQMIPASSFLAWQKRWREKAEPFMPWHLLSRQLPELRENPGSRMSVLGNRRVPVAPALP